MKLFGRLSRFLIFLSAVACILLIAEAGMESRESLVYPNLIFTTDFGQVQVFNLALKRFDKPPASCAVD